MAITRPVGRQTVLSALVYFTFADFGASGVPEPAIDLPAGSIVVGGHIQITTAFDSSVSDTLNVGDEDTADTYEASVDGQVLARSALTTTGVEYTERKKLVVEWTGSGDAPAAGAGYLYVEYVRNGRENEIEKVFG